MRLFVAAELPENLQEALAETSARLRGAVKGRYVAPDSFHMTLAFLGEVDAGRIDAIADAVDVACQEFAAFEVGLGPLGSFGKRSSATLWQGLGEQGALPELAASVREGLRTRGFDFDEKSFKAHVTLMRKADLTSGALPMPTTGRGVVDRVTLFHSDLSGPRPVYEPLHTAELSQRES